MIPKTAKELLEARGEMVWTDRPGSANLTRGEVDSDGDLILYAAPDMAEDWVRAPFLDALLSAAYTDADEQARADVKGLVDALRDIIDIATGNAGRTPTLYNVEEEARKALKEPSPKPSGEGNLGNVEADKPKADESPLPVIPPGFIE